MNQPEYPYQNGDFLVLGPEIFTGTADAGPAKKGVISWKGENYYRGKCQHIECAYCYELERRDEQQNRENLG